MSALKPSLGPGESLVPCLLDPKGCTIYPVRPMERGCCRAKAEYMQGHISIEALGRACMTLAARAEGFEEVRA